MFEVIHAMLNGILEGYSLRHLHEAKVKKELEAVEKEVSTCFYIYSQSVIDAMLLFFVFFIILYFLLKSDTILQLPRGERMEERDRERAISVDSNNLFLIDDGSGSIITKTCVTKSETSIILGSF